MKYILPVVSELLCWEKDGRHRYEVGFPAAKFAVLINNKLPKGPPFFRSLK
jgi:hypothetical protein